jgi:hypothetical protein
MSLDLQWSLYGKQTSLPSAQVTHTHTRICGESPHHRICMTCTRHPRCHQRHRHHSLHQLYDTLYNCWSNITHEHVCVNFPPENADPNCTQLTVGSNLITFPGNCGTPMFDMVTLKLHLNSVISTKGAWYCTIDFKDFYLVTPIDHAKIMQMKLKGNPPPPQVCQTQ